MATLKSYLDYAGLQSYDSLIKTWANSANQLGYKTILKSADGNSLNLYKKASAVLGTDTPDATIELGSADASAKLDALASVLGATWDATADSGNGAYVLDLDSSFASSVDTALEAINTLKTAVNTLNGDNATNGSVAKAIKDAIEALDVTEFALASKNANDIITIKGIKEVDGEIAVGTDSNNDVTFAKVAATGVAEDVSNTAIAGVTKNVSGTPTATTNVQDTLEALKALIDNTGSSGSLTIDEVSTGLATNILKAYQVYQGGTQTGGVTSGGTLIGTINIPKDFLVKNASVKTVVATDKASGGIFENDSNFAVGDKYIDFVINTADTAQGSETNQHIYINVDDLMSALTVETNADEIQLAISATNELSADVVKIAGTKIIYKSAYTDSTSGNLVAEETVVDALNNIGSIPISGNSNSVESLFSDILVGTQTEI